METQTNSVKFKALVMQFAVGLIVLLGGYVLLSPISLEFNTYPFLPALAGVVILYNCWLYLQASKNNFLRTKRFLQIVLTCVSVVFLAYIFLSIFINPFSAILREGLSGNPDPAEEHVGTRAIYTLVLLAAFSVGFFILKSRVKKPDDTLLLETTPTNPPKID